MNNDLKIGVCGIACFKCPKYISKECPGYRPNEFCPLPECAQKKGVDLCFECKELPCNLNYEKGPIVKALLDFFKEKKES